MFNNQGSVGTLRRISINIINQQSIRVKIDPRPCMQKETLHYTMSVRATSPVLVSLIVFMDVGHQGEIQLMHNNLGLV